jgi:hypothetical protein
MGYIFWQLSNLCCSVKLYVTKGDIEFIEFGCKYGKILEASPHSSIRTISCLYWSTDFSGLPENFTIEI